MAQIDREVGQQGLHVGPLVIPATDTLKRQGVPSGRRAGAASPLGGPEAKLPTQRCTPVSHGVLGQRGPWLRAKDHVGEGVVAEGNPQGEVPAELRCRGGLQWHPA